MIPKGINDDAALFLSDILPTGWMAVDNADIERDDPVAVRGCGPVGLFATQAARLMVGIGAEVVIDAVGIEARGFALDTVMDDRKQASAWIAVMGCARR